MPVIFSSGYSSDFGTEAAPLPGRIHFLQKPYKSEVLVKAVRDCHVSQILNRYTVGPDAPTRSLEVTYPGYSLFLVVTRSIRIDPHKFVRDQGTFRCEIA